MVALYKTNKHVVEKFKVVIEKVNHDAVETSSKNLKVSLKRSTRSTSNTNKTKNNTYKMIRRIPVNPLQDPHSIALRSGSAATRPTRIELPLG